MTVPSPAMLAARRKPVDLIAELHADEPARIVMPGVTEEVVQTIHDGVVKTKNLKPGQEVRPYLHGQPRGSLRTVATNERLGSGAEHRLTFSSAHPEGEFKAAYRWYDESLVGSVVTHTIKKPAFVAYQEV